MIHLRGGPDSLEPEAGHGALGHRGSLLEILEHELASRGPHLLHPVGLGVVGKPTPVSDPLDHVGF